MKLKPNQTRTYDGEGFKKRAACLCFKNEREEEVLLVSSSRHPDQWIVPGGGMEPEEEPCGAAVREVFEELLAACLSPWRGLRLYRGIFQPNYISMETSSWLTLYWKSLQVRAMSDLWRAAGVRGKLGRLLGVFEQNQDRKHRTYVYVLTVTETLEAWEDSVNIGRKREWFTVDEAIKVLQNHKPVHAEYLRRLQLNCSSTNGNSILPSPQANDNYPHFSATTASTGGVLASSRR